MMSFAMSFVVSYYGCSSSACVNLIESCSSAYLQWAYPANNPTLVIGTQQQQPSTVSVDNDQLVGISSHIYRIIDDKEIEVTTKGHKLVQKSDSHYQVKLKLEVTSIAL